MEQRECYWCHKHFDRPGDIYKYKKHYFCDDTCLGEYLVSKAEDEIEVVWHDTEENIRICALEAKGEYQEVELVAHCLFEQSGTFKGQFKALGIDAYDYDILNDYGETDYLCDLYAEIRGGV